MIENIVFVAFVTVLVLLSFWGGLIKLRRKHKALREKFTRPLGPKSPEPGYGVPGSPVTGHVRFRVDKVNPWTGFLELDGHRIRFLTLSMGIKPNELPIVTISVYARLIEGEIIGATGAIEIIHIDESTKGKSYGPPQADKENCPYTKSAYACPMLSGLELTEAKPPKADNTGGCPAGIKLDDK